MQRSRKLMQHCGRLLVPDSADPLDTLIGQMCWAALGVSRFKYESEAEWLAAVEEVFTAMEKHLKFGRELLIARRGEPDGCDSDF